MLLRKLTYCTGSSYFYLLLVAFFDAAERVVRVDTLVERAFDAVRTLLVLLPRADDLGLAAFLAGEAGFTGVAAFFTGVAAFLAGVAALLGTRATARDGVEVRTTAVALEGLADLVAALGGEATASAAL